MNIRIRDIQRSHLGQALVRFAQVHDRDLLVNHSPHPYGGVEFTVVRHNQGRNWGSLNFNVDEIPPRLLESREYPVCYSLLWKSNDLGK
jgi:hypothetical protein